MESKKPVLLDFFATWCSPCRMLSPIVDELAEEIIEEVPREHNNTAGVKTGRWKKSDVFSEKTAAASGVYQPDGYR